MSDHAPKPAPDEAEHAARVVPLTPRPEAPRAKEPLWRHLVGDVLRHERRTQERTLKDVADEARISMPYLSELERGRKEASSEVLAAVARALGLSLAELLARAHGRLAPAPRTTTSSVTRLAPRHGRTPGRHSSELRLAA
ncbi:helix-turn-helix domain-containing protein [Streptomyces millisiae]|uniref:Helix-turn-helix transcriptional regulator n=1 Tax=Streptomyces millisiae TaxID=3075542 RepID=A0ABU2LTL7_9ACTN|nr:helix-turn-helix transcriptional regulator [Streptomyces sp. DSM 44918]MDT0320398.1 helix-turn-helix transcriptional regulator [Streptomyces sp. DSM 44918]